MVPGRVGCRAAAGIRPYPSTGVSASYARHGVLSRSRPRAAPDRYYLTRHLTGPRRQTGGNGTDGTGGAGGTDGIDRADGTDGKDGIDGTDGQTGQT